MSYKTRPTGDFLEIKKGREIGRRRGETFSSLLTNIPFYETEFSKEMIVFPISQI